MKKLLTKFLNRKTNFPEDESLSALNETFFYLLNQEKQLLNSVLWRNIEYFFKHKKLYLLKLFFIILLIISGVGLIGGGTLFTLDYYNIISISKPKIIEPEKECIFLPDTAIVSISNLVKNAEFRKRYQVVIYFLPDVKKDWKRYKDAVSNIESKGDYYARDGQYWGKYQLGELARKLAGLGNMTFEEFASNPELQEGAFLGWVRYLRDQVKQLGLTKYYGKYIDGVQITESGVISMCHNAGTGATLTYLQSGGGDPPGGLQFLKIGGYDLNLE